MKLRFHTSMAAFALASLPATPGVRAQETVPTKRPMRDAAKHDELSQTLRMAQQNDPIQNLGPAIGTTEVDPSLALAERDLVKDSIILCFRGELTLIPKRSVLHLPAHLESRFRAVDGAAVKNWKDFYPSNRGWIRTVEVSREQAMGQAPLAEETVDAFASSSSVVVATFQSGPISVKPYVAPEAAPTAAN